MESLNKVISSFDLQKTLHPKIWVNGGEKMNPLVRKNLLEIAHQFIDSFGLDVVIEDIIVTGSIANYNWSEYSDVDLHILVDYKQFSEKLKSLYVEFFDLKKISFNQKRNVKMYGFDVEVFVEDNDVEGISGGVYSVMEDEWVKKPKREKSQVSKEDIIKQSKKWMRLIDNFIKNVKDEDIEEIGKCLKMLKNKIKKYRVSGLNKSGELGLENLVFKVLRRNGYIEKLYSVPTEYIDKKLSINESMLNAPLEKISYNPTSAFGVVRPGLDTKKAHPGVDLHASSGTIVYSPGDGVVIDAEIRNDGCGGTLFIDHKNGYKSRYCHLRQINVSKGDTVKQGQKVGLTGGGKGEIGQGFSTGPHLHFEIYKDGKLIDPMTVIDDEYIPSYESEDVEELKIDESEIDKIKEKIFDKYPNLKKNDESEILNPIKESKFIKEFEDLIKKGIEIKENEERITFDKNVKLVQIALQYLKYLDSNYGIDGFYDEKTINSVLNFKKDFDLSNSNDIKKEDLLILYYLMVYNLFDDAKLSEIEQKPNYKNLKLTTMNNFYETLLIALNIDITYTNLNFLKMWNDITTLEGKKTPFGLMLDEKDTTTSILEKVIRKFKTTDYSCVRNSMYENKVINEIINCDVFYKDDLVSKFKKYIKREQ